MTNEELLERLRSLNETMNLTTEPDANDGEYSELKDKKEILEREIADLRIKLSDDANYPNFNYIASRSKLDSISNKLDSLEMELERNQNAISADTNRIQEVDSEIEACNELISQNENIINELGKELRSLGENPDPEKEADCVARMASVREDLDYLRGELGLFTQERESLANSINALTSRNQDIPSLIERYQTLEASVLEKETETVNLSNKRLDENRLASLQGSLEQIDNRIDFIATAANEDIAILIAELELGVVPASDVIPRLNEIKAKFPTSLLEMDYERYEEELANNHSKQAELANQISELETRLSDPVNYTPSVFAVEVIDEEIAEIEALIKQRDEDIKQTEIGIKNAEKKINRANREIERREQRISEFQTENDEIRFRMTDASLSDQELSDLNKQLRKNNKQIERIREQIERQHKNITTQETLISTCKKDKKELENMRISETKEFDERRAALEDSKSVNRLAMIADQNALAVLVSEMSALKAQEQILDGAHLQQIDEIIANYDPVKAAEMASVAELDRAIDGMDEIISSMNLGTVATGDDQNTAGTVVTGDDQNTAGTVVTGDDQNTAGTVVASDDQNTTGTVVASDDQNTAGTVVTGDDQNTAGTVVASDDQNTAGTVVASDDQNTAGTVVASDDQNTADTTEHESELDSNGVDALMKKLESIERLFFDEERYKQGYDFLNPENAKNIGATVEPTVTKKEEKPKKKLGPVIIAKWKDASTNLVDRIKNTKFVKNLKKNLVTLGLTIAFAAGVVALGGDGKEVNIPEEPTIEDNIDDGIIQDDLDQEIDGIVNGSGGTTGDTTVDTEEPNLNPGGTTDDTTVDTEDPNLNPGGTTGDTTVDTEEPNLNPGGTTGDTTVDTEDPNLNPGGTTGDTTLDDTKQPVKNVALQKNETLVMTGNDGTTFVVDNSNGTNSSLITGNTEYVFPGEGAVLNGETFETVTQNGDGTVDVTLTNPIQPGNTNASDVKQPVITPAPNPTYTPPAEEQAYWDLLYAQQSGEYNLNDYLTSPTNSGKTR